MNKFKPGDIIQHGNYGQFFWFIVDVKKNYYIVIALGSGHTEKTTSANFGNWEDEYTIVTSILRNEEQ